MDILGHELELAAIALSILLIIIVCAVLACRYYRGHRVCCCTGTPDDQPKLPIHPPSYNGVEAKVAVLPMLGRDEFEKNVEVDKGNIRQSKLPEIELNDNDGLRKRQGELSIAIDTRHMVAEGSQIASIATTFRPIVMSDHSSVLFNPPNTNKSYIKTTNIEGEADAKSVGATLGPTFHDRGERVSQLLDLGSEGAQSSVIEWKTGEPGSTAPIKKRAIGSLPAAWPRRENPELKNPLSQSEKFRVSLPSPSATGAEERKRASQFEERSTFGTLPSLPRPSNKTEITLSPSPSIVSVSLVS